MPDARLKRAREAYRCKRCGQIHASQDFDIEYPRIIARSARNLANAIDADIAERVYAEIMNNA